MSITNSNPQTDKRLYCTHCDGEIKGDSWYMGTYISYTHQDGGTFLCNPLDFNNNNHAELAP